MNLGTVILGAVDNELTTGVVVVLGGRPWGPGVSWCLIVTRSVSATMGSEFSTDSIVSLCRAENWRRRGLALLACNGRWSVGIHGPYRP